MPKELRCLLFTAEELLEALAEEAQRAMPEVELSGSSAAVQMATAADGRVGVRLVRRQRQGRSRPSAMLEGAELLGLLLRLCKRRRIPLPMRGEKRLELVGPCLALIVTLQASQGVPRLQDGVLRYADPDLLAAEARLKRSAA
jgi:hypothetical protein